MSGRQKSSPKSSERASIKKSRGRKKPAAEGRLIQEPRAKEPRAKEPLGAQQRAGDAQKKQLKAIERAQEKSALYRIIRLARKIDEEALRRASGGDLLGITRRHLALLPHLGAEGARITTLAEQLGVTKQAASQTVSELEALGLLERVPDAQDGRAKLVMLTEAGRARILGGLEILLELERELSRGLPRGAMAALRGTLERLDTLDIGDHAPEMKSNRNRA